MVAGGGGWRREPAVMYEVVLRNGTCRNAGTSASVWITAAGHTARLATTISGLKRLVLLVYAALSY